MNFIALVFQSIMGLVAILVVATVFKGLFLFSNTIIKSKESLIKRISKYLFVMICFFVASIMTLTFFNDDMFNFEYGEIATITIGFFFTTFFSALSKSDQVINLFGIKKDELK